MQNNEEAASRQPDVKAFMDGFVRLGLIVLLAVLCVRIVSPFIGLIVWALVLAITLYPLHQRLAGLLGGRQGTAATSLVVAGLLLIGVPTVMLGSSFAGHVQQLYADFENSALTIRPPNAGVAAWPIIGERLYSAWSDAAANLPLFVQDHRAMLDDLARGALSTARNTATALLLFLAALVVAGIIMAWGREGSATMHNIFCRLAGRGSGAALLKLNTLTVRSVAAGVVGVAFIQALILGIGFILAGLPAPGVLAMIVLIVGILQLPALLISLPAIAWLWANGDGSTAVNVVWTVYLLIGGMADNVLKPMLLGRGVDVPMPVILIGALGGMIWAGIIGLFVGAALLAVGYQVFMDWVADGSIDGGASPGQVLPAAE